MTIRTLTFILGVGLTAFAFGDLKADLQKRLDAYCAIVVKKDIQGLEKWSKENCAPDFRFVADGGRPFFFKDWLRMEKQSVSQTSKVKKFSIRIDSLTQKKDTVLLKATSEASVIVPGEKGKPMTVNDTGLYGVQMVKRNGKWLVYEIKTHRGH